MIEQIASDVASPLQGFFLQVADDKRSGVLYSTGTKIINEARLKSRYKSESLSIKNNAVCFPLFSDDNARLLNYLLLDTECRAIGHRQFEVQFAVESPSFLKKQYDFTHDSGYVVLERVSIPFVLAHDRVINRLSEGHDDNSLSEKKAVLSLVANYSPELLKMIKHGVRERDELVGLANLITSFIWRLFSATGPSDKIHGSMGTAAVLNAIALNGGTVQCSGTRDLFIGVAHYVNSGIKIRKVEAFRYSPRIENVVVNGHSLIEISINGRWVAYDPFVRVYFKKNKADELCSVLDIKQALRQDRLNEIEVIHIETCHPKRQDFEPENDPLDPMNWNYFSHFNFLKYTTWQRWGN